MSRSDDQFSFGVLLRSEWILLLMIAMVPFVIALPELLHVVNANPMLAVGGLTEKLVAGKSTGYAYIDPNVGFTAQALGHLDATDLLHGILPWWNPFSGVGLPLVGELQSAPFLPTTLLFAFHGGVGIVLEHALLQAIGGIGAYVFLRSLGLRRSVALVGGLLFALNGTYAWFGDNPIMALTFIPWVLLGVEVAVRRVGPARRYPWESLAVTVALLLVAGYPETAFVGLLLAGVWAVVRLTMLGRGDIIVALKNLIVGTVLGLLLAAFALGPFVEGLSIEYLGEHGGSAGSVALPHSGVLQGLLTPYVAGPIFGSSTAPPIVNAVWDNIGGYVTIALGLAAVYGLVVYFDRLSAALAVVTVFLIGRTYGIQPFVAIFNFIPEADRVEAYRYANPTWELALIIIAMRGLDKVVSNEKRHWAGVVAVVVSVAAGVVVVYREKPLVASLLRSSQTHSWALVSLVGAAGVALVVLAILSLVRSRRKSVVLGVLLVANALVLYCVPIFANPKSGSVDTRVISFLKTHLGDHRVYSVGVLEPNYSAYYQIPSIDFNYLPLPTNTVSWINDHLEPGFSGSPIFLNGGAVPDATAQSWDASLELDLAKYEELGVGDVLVPRGDDVFSTTVDLSSAGDRVTPMKIVAGSSLRVRLAGLRDSPATITSLGVSAATGSGSKATGTMVAKICTAGTCSSGSASLQDGEFLVTFAHALTHRSGDPVSVSLSWPSLSSPISINSVHDSAASAVAYGSGLGSRTPQLAVGLDAASQVQLVYQDSVASVYQLRHSRAIFSFASGACRVLNYSTYSARYSCRHADALVYRENSFPGWSANVGGHSLRIRTVDDLFQEVRVPAGVHTVTFDYQPPHESLYMLASLVGLLGVVGGFVLDRRFLRRRTQRR